MSLNTIQKIIKIDKFLNPWECQYIKTKAIKMGFKSSRFQALGRHNQEVFLSSQEITKLIINRSIQKIKNKLDGKIIVKKYNPIEVYYYQQGDYIVSHRDIQKKQIKDIYSYFTLIIYLNNVSKGGSTFFPDLELKVDPKIGKSILFSQDLIHGGEIVKIGEKYIARTELSILFTE